MMAARPALETPWFDRFMYVLLASFFAGHAGLAILVPDGAARMLVGDRAGDRLRALTEVFAQSDLDSALAVIFRIGSPGDWVLFAPAFRIAGSFGIMAQNIAFYAVGLIVLYRLARWIMPVDTARIAVIAWALLPATVFHPHALVSEAICNPLLICLTYLLVRLELSEEAELRTVVLAGLTVGVLALVRHVYLLLPLGVAVWLILFRPVGLGSRSMVAIFLSAGLVFVAGLWGATTLASARYQMGLSVGGLQSNLYLRADRMAVMGNTPLPQSYLDRSKAAGHDVRTLRPDEFAGFAMRHPVLFAKTAMSDAFNLMANPGVAMLAGRYLGLFDLGERNYRDLNKWRETRERDGPIGVVRLLWQTSPTGFVFNLVGGVIWVAFLGLAVFGAYRFAVRDHLTPAVKVLLFGIAAYAVVLTSITAGYTRWDHRSGIEFILAMWFALGASAIAQKTALRPLRRAH